MGRLENGKWIVEEVNPKTKDGEYVRQEQRFRDWITENGDFKPERDRYHLYVSYACPWAHRALIFRELKDLKGFIEVSVVSPNMLKDGWTFDQDFPGATGDLLLQKKFLREIYLEADPRFSGKVTVPVLFDKKTKKIVNNESSEVIRIFNSAFNSITGNNEDFYPAEQRGEIDAINDEVYEKINNGVYKTGFARTQEAYDQNVRPLFEALSRLDERLEGQSYLVGDRLTEADVRLFTTLIRFDSVYYVHFKCNYKQIREYKNLSRYLRELYNQPPFQTTTHFDHIKRHYYYSHETLNPFRIVPWGPSELL